MLEVAWLGLGVAGTAVAWWYWYLDYRRRITSSVAGDAGVSAYLTLVFMATLTFTAITRWRRGESLCAKPLLTAVAIAAILALSFNIIMVLVGLIVFFVWGPWPNELVSLAFVGTGIALHAIAIAICWRHLSFQRKN